MGAHSDKPGPDPQPKDRLSSQRVTVRMTVAERNTIVSVASEEEITINDLVRDAIALYCTLPK